MSKSKKIIIGQMTWTEVDVDTSEMEDRTASAALAAVDTATDTLVRDARAMIELQALLAERIAEVRLELRRRLEEDEATEYRSSAGRVNLVPSRVVYDQDALDGVLEHLDRDELIDAGALVEEHEEVKVVERYWNATKLRPFRGRGRAVREIIEGARQEQGTRVDIGA